MLKAGRVPRADPLRGGFRSRPRRAAADHSVTSWALRRVRAVGRRDVRSDARGRWQRRPHHLALGDNPYRPACPHELRPKGEGSRR